jgi:hypothetical protein
LVPSKNPKRLHPTPEAGFFVMFQRFVVLSAAAFSQSLGA